MKKIFILMTIIWAGMSVSCSENEEDSTGGSATAGTYTVKATIENGGTLHGGTIYIDTELNGESRDYNLYDTITGKTEWEGSYDMKKSIKVQIDARGQLTEESVLTIYLLKDGIEIKKDVKKGIGYRGSLLADVSIIL